MVNKTLAFGLLASLCIAAAACGGSHSDGTSTGPEQDITGPGGSTCAPMNTLTCAPGEEASPDGCASPRIAGGPTYGRCVSSAGKAVIGSWRNAAGEPDSLLFYAFTFDASGSYDATGGCNPNGPGAHCFAITHSQGKWSIEKGGPQLGAPGGVDQLVLVDQFGQKTAYFFSADAKTLSLSTVFRGMESVFTKQ
jgi:hypothetical protein